MTAPPTFRKRSEDGRIPISERQFQNQVLQLARLYGWLAYHTWSSIHSAAGFPDLVLVRPPRLLFLELKSAKGKLSPTQLQWGSALSACPGAWYGVFRPDDLERIADLLA